MIYPKWYVRQVSCWNNTNPALADIEKFLNPMRFMLLTDDDAVNKFYQQFCKVAEQAVADYPSCLPLAVKKFDIEDGEIMMCCYFDSHIKDSLVSSIIFSPVSGIWEGGEI